MQKPEQLDQTNTQNQRFSGIVLSAAILLFSYMILNIATILDYPDSGSLLVAASSLLPPFIASLIAVHLQKRHLANWLWAGFLIAIPMLGNWLLPYLEWLSSTMLWGISAAIALGLTIITKSRICLVISAVVLMIWGWFAYMSNPPADFLWSYLLLLMLGMAWSKRTENQIASALFAIALVIWTLFTAQAAMVIHPYITAQVTWISSLFLLTCLLVLHATSNKKKPLGFDGLILIIASTIGPAFTFYLFSVDIISILTTATRSSTASLLWVLLAALLVLVSLISLIYGRLKSIDRAGIITLLLLILIAIFAPISPSFFPLWLAITTGTLSIAGIWLALRAFAAKNTLYGFCGLGIWGGSVLLATYNINDQWLQIAVLAIYSFAAVGFYLAAERQHLKKKPKAYK
ncbi:MAG: hypothetical protein L3J04_06910 [Robiginitomaculum sp.]|nr:hypothetical protein [Robiginitomaculum sp.]